MKNILFTTTAIVGLTAPALTADPSAVSDQPYFANANPIAWSGAMSIKLTNPSNSDSTDMKTKDEKKDRLFGLLGNNNNAGVTGEEAAVAAVANHTANQTRASNILSSMATQINAHTSYTIGDTTFGAAGATANVSAIEDVIDDFLGGSHSNAMDVIIHAWGNGNGQTSGSGIADLDDDIRAFQASQDAEDEAYETAPSINTLASLGVSMSAGDGWKATTGGTINIGGGSVSSGTLSLSNGLMTISVGKTQHAAAAAVSTIFGMDVGLDTNSSDNQLQAIMNLGGTTLKLDNEIDGDNLESKNQTIGIKGTYGTTSYGLGWQADGDLGFSIGASLGSVDFTISRVNAGANYSMGLGARVDLGSGMTLNASNAQNSDGLQDKSLTYSALTNTATAYAGTNTITDVFALKAVHKSISTVGLSYAGGGTSVGITYQEKAGTSAAGDNLIASGSMAISPTITLNGTYNKDDALTTIGASSPLGSAGTISAVMTSTGSSTLTASFKF